MPRFGRFAKGAGDNCACNRLLTVAMIAALDDSVKNLTAAFQQAGLWENSVTIFMGDNGGPVNNGHSNVPFRGGKLNWWEGGIRPAAWVHSPLLPPSIGTSRWYDGIVHETDWAVTILRLAERASADHRGGRVTTEDEYLGYAMDGVDQWPAMCSAMTGTPISPPPRTQALLAHNILRRGPWKLIAGSGTDNQTWDQGMLRDCMLGTGGGWDRPPTVAGNGTVGICPTSIYKYSWEDAGSHRRLSH
jgi:hypothetical protein